MIDPVVEIKGSLMIDFWCVSEILNIKESIDFEKHSPLLFFNMHQFFYPN